MFEVIPKSLKTGIVTTNYPDSPPEVSSQARGKPEIDFARWKDARAAVAVCPTGAMSLQDNGTTRKVSFDLANCVFCGLCAETDPAIRMSNATELAATERARLKTEAKYQINAQGVQTKLLTASPGEQKAVGSLDAVGDALKARIRSVLGRSLHVREVDAGSCNGCEIEIVGLNSPIYDAERFGVHFVASPRHADMLLVTGPVTRNMELALKKTYDAMPAPRLVVAVGACGCAGGIFGRNYATVGAVDAVLPVDVYIPGCPPNPHALLHGILLAVERLNKR